MPLLMKSLLLSTTLMELVVKSSPKLYVYCPMILVQLS
jgi:hypothetical protein